MNASEREGTNTELFSRSALQERLQCTAGKGHIMAYSDLHYRLQIFPLADKRPILWRTVRQAAFVVCYLYRGRCPRLLIVVPSRHQSAFRFLFLPRI